MMNDLWLDLETYSELDIKSVGTYNYAANCEILLCAYAIDDAPAEVWDCTTGDPMPDLLLAAIANRRIIITAHNAMFDRNVLTEQMDEYEPHIPRWRCTMAQALSHALPGKLSDLCRVLKVPEDKSKIAEGKKLINLFCKPQPANRKIRRATRETHPEEWARFIKYAANDIEAMRECHKRMPTWNWDETAIAEWHFDQQMNDFGFAVDTDLTAAGARAAVEEKERITKRFAELTEGIVARPSQRAQFMAFLNNRYDLSLDNTQGGTFTALMAERDDLPADCRELMQLSISANKTSTAKYAALNAAVSPDGRFRGGLQFAGASRTRRFAGRIFQPQNLPARGLPPQDEIDYYIKALKSNTHTMLCDGDLMKLGAAALRGCVIAPEGKKLVVSDLSNIEGRVLAWLAGENWKLQAFRDYDAGTGPDLYNITAVSIIGGDPWDVAKSDRNVFGKVPDLASGYQGGVAGYQTFARSYGVRMADHWDTMQKMIDKAFVLKAHENLRKWGYEQLESLNIDETEWLASETCKLAWRARHPATCKLWYDLQDAAVSAIRIPGRVFKVGQHLKLMSTTLHGHRWLLMKLPSGRFLTYFEPAITKDGSITYWGEATEQGKTTRQWIQCFTHGGKFTGNCCQTTARDILVPSMPKAAQMGGSPILSVHDEVLVEADDNDDFTVDDLNRIIAENPAWAGDLPLAADGFEAPRYRK